MATATQEHPATQKHRVFAVQSTLGEDVLLFWRMEAKEGLSQLFEFNLEMFSEKSDIKPADVLGTNMTVRMDLKLPDQQVTRYLNGYVTQFGYVGVHSLRYEVYRARLNPWLWFLTRTSDCRIFQNMKVPDIIKEIFTKSGFTDFKDRLSGSYREWEYCVQYRETDFNFVSRLMEHEGIYYYFIHENGKHKLVLADGYSSHESFPGYKDVPYFAPDPNDYRRRDHLSEWFVSQQVQPGSYALKDYDFKGPRKDLKRLSDKPKKHAQANFKMYDYPGKYVERGDGDNYCKIRREELQAQHEIAKGRGDAAGLGAGYLFNLSRCPREEQNREYLITSAVHYCESDEYETVSGPLGATKPYKGEITAIDAQQPYRALRITPKPVVHGPQTAIVVGPSGEEIYTDKYARVKCQFHWDRYGQSNENSSCWIRVSQMWAGKQWGAMNIPRIGQEVIVDFLEGDPDQPIITGRVYNDDNMPPYGLPAKATTSTLKSSSSKGGAGFNEIRLDDTKSQEQMFIHAQRNQDIRIEKDALEWIGNEQHLIVKADRKALVEGKEHLIVKSDQKAKIEGDQHVTVSGVQNTTVTGTVSLQTSNDLQIKASMNHALEAGMCVHLKAGMTLVIEAGLQLTLKVGGNFIDISPAGVAIQGTLVMINSGGAAGSGSGCKADKAKEPDSPKEADKAEAGGKSDTQAGAPPQQQRHSLDSVRVEGFQPDAGSTSSAGGGPTPAEKAEPSAEKKAKPPTQPPNEAQVQQAKTAKNASDTGKPFYQPPKEVRPKPRSD